MTRCSLTFGLLACLLVLSGCASSPEYPGQSHSAKQEKILDNQADLMDSSDICIGEACSCASE